MVNGSPLRNQSGGALGIDNKYIDLNLDSNDLLQNRLNQMNTAVDQVNPASISDYQTVVEASD